MPDNPDAPPAEETPPREESPPAEGAMDAFPTEDEEGIPRADEGEGGEEGEDGEGVVEDGEGEGEEGEGEDTENLEMNGPAPSPAFADEEGEGVAIMDMEKLLMMLTEATAAVRKMTPTELIKSLHTPTDIHNKVVASAKAIGANFVEKASELAAAMKLILLFDQLVVKKLNQSTVYDYGYPKTDEDTKALMMTRAQQILAIGQQQYEVSHKLSDAAHPLIEMRYEACELASATHAKILKAIGDAKEAAKAAELAAIQAAVEAEAALAAAEADGEGEGSESGAPIDIDGSTDPAKA